MIYKRFVTALILSTLILGMIAINSVEASDPVNYEARGRPTRTPTATPTPIGPPGGGSGEIDYGSLYGDLYVILRNVDGVPILDEYGCVQPISIITGEPFQLLTDLAADILCELTAEMATWVEAVDFGRLNMGRAPNAVLFHAFDEAINLMNSASAFDLDPAGRLMMLIGGEWKTIDAPAENLALYIKMMQEGHWITTDTSPIVRGGPPEGSGPPVGEGPSAEPRPVLSPTAISLLGAVGYGNLGDVNNTLNNHDLLLAASLLSAAADKTGTMTLDKVIYINSILGINQLGTLPGELAGITYFDFRGFGYDRLEVYGNQRGSMECRSAFGNGYLWVLRPADDTGLLWASDCLNTLSEVHHLRGNETMNVRGFVQAADDALQVIEYIHEFRVPVPLPELP
ncbi:MAG: hypothetical protein HY864_10390 [Chloroflexi bacterium]|nr:hypothetical protein [Chloroflexota bacterium]